MPCNIYDKRPEVCRIYYAGNRIPECTFYFIGSRFDGNIQGQCCHCGQCCILYKDIFNIGSDFVKGVPCKYLDQGSNTNLV